MKSQDMWINFAIVLIMLCHILAILIGYKIQKTVILTAYINAIVVISLLIYWVNKNLHIQQHYFEWREAFVLCAEACLIISAIYAIIGFHEIIIVKWMNYFGFGLHFLALIAMLIFMVTFKMERLF
jgi:hypothetical protein